VEPQLLRVTVQNEESGEMFESLLKPPVIITFVLAVACIIAIALVSGSQFSAEDFELNPRSDVVRAEGGAQLIRQDASQRAILLVPRAESGKVASSACSEPPPDVAQDIAHTLNSSLAAIGEGNGIDAKFVAQISSDLKSAAELLFQRSQGIQLLRDTMFRLCESFQNGVLTPDDYRSLIQNLINTANFIIPFEQCTGIIRSSQKETSPLDADILQACLEVALTFNGLPAKKREGSEAAPEPIGTVSPFGRSHMPNDAEEKFKGSFKVQSMDHKIQVESLGEEVLKLTVENEVLFDFNSAAVKPDFKPILADLAHIIMKGEGNRVTIVGHTDSVGAEPYNESLSARRVQAVQSELAIHGVPARDISAIGKGETEPRATNDTNAGRQHNRRVEVFVDQM
jgi:outer membrane protein OmpA-like peptidoglycan-associated protein